MIEESNHCECGLDLSAVHTKRPEVNIRCFHDGTLGVSLHPDETFIKLHPGDNLEVRWRLTYPTDGGPPVMQQIGVDNGHWGIQKDDRSGADASIDSGIGTIAGNHTHTLAAEDSGTSVIPDGIEPLVGYRAWVLTDEGLKSTAHDYYWKPGVDVAVCQQQRDGHHVSFDLFLAREQLGLIDDPMKRAAAQAEVDRAIMAARRSPERNCMCGFYAVFEPGEVRNRIGDIPDLVFGRVKAWGKIAEYSEGFRAEKVQIDALFLPRGIIKRRRVRKLAKEYGIPIESSPISFESRKSKFSYEFLGFWGGMALSAVAGGYFWGFPGAAISVALFGFALIGGTMWIDYLKLRHR